MGLVGASIRIQVSDPWDFVTTYGDGPFRGKIVAVKSGESGSEKMSALVEVNEQVQENLSLPFKYLIVSARYEFDTIDLILSSEGVDCAMIPVSIEQAKSLNPFDLSKWRGGQGLIGTITE
jgi:hypothetical protein